MKRDLQPQLDDAVIREALTQAAQHGVTSHTDLMWRVQRKLAGQRSRYELSAGRKWSSTSLVILVSLLFVAFAGSILGALQLASRDMLSPVVTSARVPFPSQPASATQATQWHVSAFSADTLRAAFVTQNGTTVVWDLRDNRQILAIAPPQVAPSNGAASSPDWTPMPAWLALDATGSTLAIRMSDDMFVWDVDRNTPVSSLKLQPGSKLLALSRDGRLLAASDINTAVDLYDVRTGRWITSLAGQQASLASLVFSPDGRRLIAITVTGEVRTWELPRRNWEVTVEP